MWGAIKKAINSNLNKSLDVLIQEKVTETNGKVDSIDTKVQNGNNLIGATNNTGGTATSGSIFAKLNKLLTDWTTIRAGYLDAINTNVGTLLNGRVVKSVQRGVLTLDMNTIWTIPLTSINPSKSQVILDGIAYTTSSLNLFPYVQSLTSNNLVIDTLGGNNSAFKYKVSWQVIEFY